MYTHIFFDLDGTLTDPKDGITNSVAYALASFGIQEDPDRLTPFIGPPLIDSFMEFYHFDLPTAQKAVEKYREYFSQKGIFENKVFSGTQPLLAQLKEVGLDALECHYPQHTRAQTAWYLKLANMYGLYVTAGSDFHGERVKPDVSLMPTELELDWLL